MYLPTEIVWIEGHLPAMVRCKCEPPVLGYVVRHHDRERWSLVRTSYGTAWWPWRDLREVAA